MPTRFRQLSLRYIFHGFKLWLLIGTLPTLQEVMRRGNFPLVISPPDQLMENIQVNTSIPLLVILICANILAAVISLQLTLLQSARIMFTEAN